MMKAFSDYFKDLFGKTTNCGLDMDWNELYSSSFNLESLDRPFSKEIKDAIFSFEVDKSPGPDGFSFGFFQHFWDIAYQDFFNSFQ